MPRRYYSNVPISEPVRGFTENENMGGFGWDQVKGLFIIVDEEPDMFIPPQKPNGDS